MTATALIDEAIDSYHGDSLEMVLIGSDYWSDFLRETGLTPVPVGGNDTEVIYRGLSCREAIGPDAIKLVFGD